MNIIFLVISAFGFLDAAFLTQHHYTRDPLVCPIFGGCDAVTNSAYSEVFGIPIALFGALFYATIFLLSLASYLSNNKKYLHIASLLTPFGIIASVILVSLMMFVIKEICFYCVMSATSSTLLFCFGMIYLSREWKKTQQHSPKESERN